jgi:ubiquinone biosynthesis protein
LPEIKPLLQRELPKWRRAGIQLGPALLAEGSVAVIIPFVWRGQAGVFKLLKSDIRHKLADDLEILGQLGEFLDSDCENYHLPPLDYGETFDTIRDLLLHEVRLEEEQKHLSEAAKMYAHLPMVTVPALLPFCSSRLTAMQRIPGVKIAESSPAGAHMRMALARAVSQALVVEPLFSQQSAPLFHADPHAGNLLRTPENKLAILDWSLTGRLSKSARVELVQLLLGALTLDGAKMAKAIEHLSHRPPGAALIDVLEQHLQKLGWGTLPGFGWLTRLLDELVVRAGVRFDSDLLLFRKSLLTLEGVLADLLESDVATACRILDEALLAGLLQHSSREWAQRLISPLLSRHFRTHLATTDLLECFWSAPLTAARWWNLQLAESVNRGRTRN